MDGRHVIKWNINRRRHMVFLKNFLIPDIDKDRI